MLYKLRDAKARFWALGRMSQNLGYLRQPKRPVLHGTQVGCRVRRASGIRLKWI